MSKRFIPKHTQTAKHTQTWVSLIFPRKARLCRALRGNMSETCRHAYGFYCTIYAETPWPFAQLRYHRAG